VQLLADVRLALRLLRRDPASASIALLSIALSVSATAVVFAAIKSVLIDPLPYRHPEDIVQLRSEWPRMQQQSHGDWVVWNDTRELPRRTRTLESIGVFGNAIFDLAGDSNSTPEALYGGRMNANLFSVLGVSPMMGRGVLPEEDVPSHPDVMILSYGLWVRRFHADRSVVGRTVTVNGHGCLVVGVMPPEFNFPLRREAAHTPSPYVEFWATPFGVPQNPEAGFRAVARLRPGVSLAEAQQDLSSISRSLAHDFPATNRDRILTLHFLRDRVIGSAGKNLLLLMAAALLFMLIGCANVANLLLARGLRRRREMAIRLAVGAGYWRIVRQLLIESCVLAVLGGMGGYLLTAAAWKILPTAAPVSIPRLAAARADGVTLAFALVLATLNGILFGIAPALRMAGSKNEFAGFGSRGAASDRRDGLRSSLVIVEVALSVLLVVTGGQVLASFVRLVTTDPGFEADRVLASVILPAPERYRSPEKRGLFYRRILDSAGSLPGVESAGTVDALPFSGENHGGFVSSRGASDPHALTPEVDVIGGEYLQAMGIHLAAGRSFREEEMSESNDAAIVSAIVARRLWPGASAVGQRICVDCTPENPSNWKRVIGVVSDASHSALNTPERANVYLAAGAMQEAAFLVVRTERPAGEMETAIRRAIAAIDPDQPVFLSVSMRDLIADSVADQRFIMMLLGITGGLALMLAAAGVYGVMSYITSRRTQEIGIRIALGATPGNVFSLFFRQAFVTVSIGLAIGMGGVPISMRLLQQTFPGLEPGHVASAGIAALLVTVAGAMACWVPARRATRTDPMAALRQE
jgi:putative ABC transport system permease protein